MNVPLRTRALGALLVGLMIAGSANLAFGQGVNTSNPNLPPDGVYLTPDQVHAMYNGPGLAIVLTAVQHRPFAAQSSRHPGPTATGVGTSADEIEDFQSSMSGMVSVNGGAPQPANATGPVEVISFSKTGNVTGTFNTEMLQLNLSGASPFGPFMIRESPSRPSLGQTKITNIGGGMFHIDSFFDVFTELSIDGGNTWMPSVDAAGNPAAAHVNLVPEPSSFVLCGLGLAGLGFVVRRRRRKA